MCIKYSHVSYIFLTISFCILHATQLQSSSILMVDTSVTRSALNLCFKVIKRPQISKISQTNLVIKDGKFHKIGELVKMPVSNLSLSSIQIFIRIYQNYQMTQAKMYDIYFTLEHTYVSYIKYFWLGQITVGQIIPN